MGEWDVLASSARKRRRWPRIVGIIGGGILLFLMLAYFVVTSGWFLKAVVLSKTGAALNASITAESVSLSPFSAATLTGLKVQTFGQEPLFRAQTLRARFSLIDILNGHINIAEIAVVSPRVHLIQNADGTSNLDPILKSFQGKPATEKPTRATESTRLSLQNFGLTQGTMHYTRILPGGGSQTADLSVTSLTAENLGNNQSGRIKLSAQLKLDQGLAGPSNGLLQATIEGDCRLSLDGKLNPSMLQGGLKLQVPEAHGTFGDAAGASLSLTADMTPSEVREMTIQLAKAGQSLATVTASGPFDTSKLEGAINLSMSGLDRQLLNVVGARFRGDFNATTIDSTNLIELAQGAKLIRLHGRISLNQFSLTQAAITTPSLNLVADYHLSVDQIQKSSRIETLTITATQNQADLLRGSLRRPITLDWSGTASAVDESAFDLTLTNLNLADWRAFAPGIKPSGAADLKLDLQAQQAGRKLILYTTAHLTNFAATFASNHLTDANLSLRLAAEMDDFSRISLTAVEAHLAHQDKPVLGMGTSGRFNAQTLEADLQTSLALELVPLAKLLANPDLQILAGNLRFAGRITQAGQAPTQSAASFADRTLAGTLRLADFTGNWSGRHFDHFESVIDGNLSLQNQVGKVEKLSAVLRQAGQEGGRLELSATYDLAKTNVQARLQLADLNQNVLRSLAAPALGSNRLESVSVSLDATASHDSQTEHKLQGTLQIGDLRIRDTAGRLPKEPLSLATQFEVALTNDTAALRRFQGSIHQGPLPGGAFAATAAYHLKNKTAQVALMVTNLNQRALQPLLAQVPAENALASVLISLNAKADYNPGGDSSVKGEFRLADLLLADAKGLQHKEPLNLVVKVDGLVHDNLAELRQCVGYINQGDLLGGSFDLKGQYHLIQKTCHAEARLIDLNQNALQPLLSGWLTDRSLQSVSVNLSADIRQDVTGESSLKADLQMANLLVKDLSGKFPTLPLSAGLQVDGSVAQKLLALRQLRLSLTETPRGRNQIELRGQLNLANSNAVMGNLLLSAQSLDLTPYYDVFARGAKPAVPAAAAPGPQTSAERRVAAREPDPIRLPFDQFAFEAAIDRLFLREIDISDLKVSAQIEGSRIKANPMRCSLNGGEFNGRTALDLGVPGWTYEIAMGLNHIPLEPILNTFEASRPGGFQGFLGGTVDLKGAGLRAPSLQQNLRGGINFDLTEARLSLLSSDSTTPGSGTFFTKVFKPIAAVLRIPDLSQSPVRHIQVRSAIADRTVKLEQCLVESPLFQARSAGTLTLADDLMETRLNLLPVDIALERSTAVKAHLASSNAAPAEAYVKLPTLAQVSGTISEPVMHPQSQAIAELMARMGVSTLQDGAAAEFGAAVGVIPAVSAIPGIQSPLGTPAVPPTAASVPNPALPKSQELTPKVPETPKPPKLTPKKPGLVPPPK
jgi:hypothetical protein